MLVSVEEGLFESEVLSGTDSVQVDEKADIGPHKTFQQHTKLILDVFCCRFVSSFVWMLIRLICLLQKSPSLAQVFREVPSVAFQYSIN